MNTVVSSRGQIALPAELRQQDRILPGQQFDIKRLETGQYLLKRRVDQESKGMVDWLLACPEKDWFEPIPSQATNTL